MARQTVTIYDVAARAGVGISTVSNTLNKPDRVSPKTRKRVLDAAAELGFVPKSEAVSRARRGVGRIGVIAPFVSYNSYMRRLAGVLEVMNRNNLEVCIFDEESAAAKSSLLLSQLPLNSRLDGLIIMGIPLDDDAAQRLLDGRPAHDPRRHRRLSIQLRLHRLRRDGTDDRRAPDRARAPTPCLPLRGGRLQPWSGSRARDASTPSPRRSPRPA